MSTLKTLLVTFGLLLLKLGHVLAQPVITTQPADQTNVASTTATFFVAATGTAPVTNQWRYYSAGTIFTNIPFETNATLVLMNVQQVSGRFAVVVCDPSGSVTSRLAKLTVIYSPIITVQPTNFLALSLGASVGNRVTASSTTPLVYQWRRDGTNLPRQTNPTILLTNMQLADVGGYTVVIANIAGAVTSYLARLEIDPTFTKITAGRIVNDGGASIGCAWGDYDDDGFIDLFVTNWGDTGLDGHDFLYHNNHDGTFTRITTGPAVNDPSPDADAATWADYDNDGHLDLLVTKWGRPNTLYHNNGDGTFTLANTILSRQTQRSEAGVWGDFDNDGWLDLFVPAVGETGLQAAANILYQSDQQGDFKPISFGTKPLGDDFSLAAAWGDFDNDGYLDLVVSQGGWDAPQHTLLYHNNRNGTFALLTNSVLSADLLNHEGCAWGDFNNDGWLDLCIGNFYGQNNSLFLNNGDGSFTKITNSIVTLDGGTTKTVTWADYDNDGWLDLFVANAGPRNAANILGDETNFLYHNNGDGTFTKITSGSLVHDRGHFFGAAWGDYDNDGFPDLFVCAGFGGFNENNLLYRNNGNSNAWVNLRLIGTVSNRSAIGAKVRLKATIHGRTFWQMREISGGSGIWCQNDMRANFGLGDATNADMVRIEWPSGLVQTFTNVVARQFLTITEPPRLIVATAGGQPQFTLKGGRNMSYDLQTSTNLADWSITSAVTITNLNGATPIPVPLPSESPQQFYRAVLR